MTLLDQAKKYLRKAKEDEIVLDKLIDDKQVSDFIWGFHAQQAAEKLLKSVLTIHKIEFEKTHDLVLLSDLLIKNKIKIVFDLAKLENLNPYAVAFRYDDDVDKDKTLNRKDTKKFISEVRKWAEDLMKNSSG